MNNRLKAIAGVGATLALLAAGTILTATALGGATPKAGKFSGRTAAGFEVTFTVARDRRSVRAVRTKVRYRCAANSPLVTATFKSTRSIGLRNGHFSRKQGPITISGTFVTLNRARGTISIFKRLSSQTTCKGSQTWSARRR
jgi:hypothetical protein